MDARNGITRNYVWDEEEATQMRILMPYSAKYRHRQNPQQVLTNNIAKLVVVPVAEGGVGGIHDLSDLDSGPDVVDVDAHAQVQCVAADVVSVDILRAAAVHVLPNAEFAVNEAMVEPEDWVTGRSKHVSHDTTDTVVTPSVWATFDAGSLVGEIAPSIALVDVSSVDVCGGTLISCTLKTVRVQ